ncbi:hypothetical protein DH86_00000405, partial [Scytalidium sp. 3C]
KQRCDGKTPCSRCTRLDLDCARLRSHGRHNRPANNTSGQDGEQVEQRKKYRAVTVRRDRTGCDTCKKRNVTRKNRSAQIVEDSIYHASERFVLPRLRSHRPPLLYNQHLPPQMPSFRSRPNQTQLLCPKFRGPEIAVLRIQGFSSDHSLYTNGFRDDLLYQHHPRPQQISWSLLRTQVMMMEAVAHLLLSGLYQVNLLAKVLANNRIGYLSTP